MMPVPAEFPPAPPPGPPPAPPAGGGVPALDLAALQAALAPYDHLARLRNALLYCVGLPGTAMLTVYLRGNATEVKIDRVQVDRPPRSLDDTPCWTPAIAVALLATLSSVDRDFPVLVRRVERWALADKGAWTARLVVQVVEGVPDPSYRVSEPEPAE
jgi:hypothetical protein